FLIVAHVLIKSHIMQLVKTELFWGYYQFQSCSERITQSEKQETSVRHIHCCSDIVVRIQDNCLPHQQKLCGCNVQRKNKNFLSGKYKLYAMQRFRLLPRPPHRNHELVNRSASSRGTIQLWRSEQESFYSECSTMNGDDLGINESVALVFSSAGKTELDTVLQSSARKRHLPSHQGVVPRVKNLIRSGVPRGQTKENGLHSRILLEGKRTISGKLFLQVFNPAVHGIPHSTRSCFPRSESLKHLHRVTGCCIAPYGSPTAQIPLSNSSYCPVVADSGVAALISLYWPRELAYSFQSSAEKRPNSTVEQLLLHLRRTSSFIRPVVADSGVAALISLYWPRELAYSFQQIPLSNSSYFWIHCSMERRLLSRFVTQLPAELPIRPRYPVPMQLTRAFFFLYFLDTVVFFRTRKIWSFLMEGPVVTDSGSGGQEQGPSNGSSPHRGDSNRDLLIGKDSCLEHDKKKETIQLVQKVAAGISAVHYQAQLKLL
ncbi:Reverse transcriptase domain-containing protein, partial [Podarcis lilfordi]